MEKPNEETCLFRNILERCTSINGDLYKAPLSDLKLARVIESSIDRNDNLHESLSKETQAQHRYHYNCYITYVDTRKVASCKRKYESANANGNSPSSSKKILRSQEQVFDLKKNCFICGDNCSLEKDPKHPEIWKPASLCSTSERVDKGGNKYPSFKENMLKVINIPDVTYPDHLKGRDYDFAFKWMC